LNQIISAALDTKSCPFINSKAGHILSLTNDSLHCGRVNNLIGNAPLHRTVITQMSSLHIVYCSNLFDKLSHLFSTHCCLMTFYK
jgi:hypothetical protein